MAAFAAMTLERQHVRAPRGCDAHGLSGSFLHAAIRPSGVDRAGNLLWAEVCGWPFVTILFICGP